MAVLTHTNSRIPRYDASTLTEWYLSNIPTHTSQLLQYMSERTAIILEILEESEFVTKTAYVHLLEQSSVTLLMKPFQRVRSSVWC